MQAFATCSFLSDKCEARQMQKNWSLQVHGHTKQCPGLGIVCVRVSFVLSLCSP